MHRLHPDPAPISDLVAEYSDDRALGTRPYVIVNMVTSLDGATQVDGLSGGLGGEGDHEAFVAIRAQADVILAGAATVRAEGYGPPSATDVSRARRERTGAWPVARIAIVSNSLDLDLGSDLFAKPTSRPIVVTSESSPIDRRTEVSRVADVAIAGGAHVEMTKALDALAETGARVVLCEGGPTINGQLAREGLLDEMCLTLAPVVVGGDSARAVHGPSLPVPTAMVLSHVLGDDEGYLYLRYRAG